MAQKRPAVVSVRLLVEDYMALAEMAEALGTSHSNLARLTIEWAVRDHGEDAPELAEYVRARLLPEDEQ
jgi:hypothetical protein